MHIGVIDNEDEDGKRQQERHKLSEEEIFKDGTSEEAMFHDPEFFAVDKYEKIDPTNFFSKLKTKFLLKSLVVL